MFQFLSIIFSAGSYSLDIVWSRRVVELQVSVWVEAVVVLTALLFTCLNQCRTLLVKSRGDVKQSQQCFMLESVNMSAVLCCMKLVQSSWSYLCLFFRMSFPSGDWGFTHFSLFAIVTLGEKKEREKPVREKLNNAGESCQLYFSSFTHMISVFGQKIVGWYMTGSVWMSCGLTLPMKLFTHLHLLDLLAGCPGGGREDTVLFSVRVVVNVSWQRCQRQIYLQ